MEIIKNKRKSECNFYSCNKKIDSKYKIKENGKTYHLSCYLKWLKRKLEKYKMELKELNKQKYKRIIILENLQ